MGPFFIVFSILPMAILLLAAVWCIRSLWITLMPPRGWKGGKGAAKVRGIGAEPVCEKCRYPVLGLTTFQCPECGTDLRRTGIITRSMEMRRRGGLGAALISLTLIMGVGTSLTLAALSEWLRPTRRIASQAACTLTLETGSAIREVVITTSGQTGVSARSTMSLVSRSGFSYYYTVDAANGTIADFSGGSTLRPLELSSLSAVMADAGLDPASELAKSQTEQLMGLLKTVGDPDRRLFSTPTNAFAKVSVNQAASFASRREYAIWMWGVGITCVVIWIMLLLLVIRRRRRILREVDAREAAIGLDAAPSTASPAGPPPSP